MENIKNELEKMKNELKSNGKQPILFVGSGISRRYLNLPDWKGLLKLIAERSNIDIEQFKDFSDNEKIAQELEYYYFRNQPDANIKDKRRKELMRDAIADIIKNFSEESKVINYEIEEFSKIRPKAIITTNYDVLLEKIFHDRAQVHIGQKIMTPQEAEDKIDIYKIHGCISQPDSIVITKEDYDEFFEKSKYLYAKMLTLFCEYPLIFMGYSLTDRNIKDVLTTIAEMMSTEQLEKFSKQIWILGRNEGAAEDKVNDTNVELLNGRSLKVKCFYLSDYKTFFNAISSVTNNHRFGGLKFSISEDVIELLIKPLYGQQDSLKVVTRELLQNALDACKKKEVNADIIIKIHEKGDDLFLEVKDNGIGMDIQDIRTNFLTVGKSDKRNSQNGLVGKYGIGILSLFLLGEYAEIYTMKKRNELLAFKLHIEENKKQVSWMDDVDSGILETLKDQSSYTLLRIKIKEKEKISNLKSQEEIFRVLGLDGYLTNEHTKITIIYNENKYEVDKLEVGDYFYKVNDEVSVYRSEWLDADKKETLSSTLRAVYEQRNTILFNDMISRATYITKEYNLLRNSLIPFVVLNIKNLDEREEEFKTTLSRNNVELTGEMAEGILNGIYTMEVEKIADIIKSKYSAIKSSDYDIKELRKLLMRECTVFGKNADILIKKDKLFITSNAYSSHMEIWGGNEDIGKIVKNIEDEIVLYKNLYLHKTSIADKIKNNELIAISNIYLDEYIYQATGPTNGLRTEAVKIILDFLNFTRITSLASSTEVWSFVQDNKHEIKEKYDKKGNNGILWFKDEHRSNCEHISNMGKVVIFKSSYLPNTIDHKFDVLLKKKLKEEGLEEILGTL